MIARTLVKSKGQELPGVEGQARAGIKIGVRTGLAEQVEFEQT